MEKMLGPTGAMLVGTTFVCLCLMLCMSSAAQQSIAPDSLSKIQEFHSDFINHKQKFDTGKLKLPGNTICFPWASRQVPGLEPHRKDVMPRSRPVSEKIPLSGDHPEEQVQDLKSINAVKQRDIVCEETQNGNPESQGLVNSLDVSLTGKGQGKKEWPYEGLDDNSLEQIVDNAVNSGRENGRIDSMTAGGNPGQKRLGNYMNIDVSGVSVSAINTVEGGSAVATSNIIIKPVQVIVYPSEAEEKLK
jgi:hypothetical protein